MSCICGEGAFSKDECFLDAIKVYGFHVILSFFMEFSIACNTVLTVVVVAVGGGASFLL